MMDKEMQEFVMYYGEGDNNSAYMFVEQMRIITLKKMDDTEIEDEKSSKNSGVEMEDLDITLSKEDNKREGDNKDEDNQHSLENTRGGLDEAADAATHEEDDANNEASNDLSGKTQDDVAMAEAKNAGKESEESPGQALS